MQFLDRDHRFVQRLSQRCHPVPLRSTNRNAIRIKRPLAPPAGAFFFHTCPSGVGRGIMAHRGRPTAIEPEARVRMGNWVKRLGVLALFGWVLAAEQIPQRIAELFLSLTRNYYALLLLINVLLLILGTFMETIAIIIIVVPVLMPLVTNLGMDPIHFGVMVTVNLAIGLITPPVGVLLFVVCGITGYPFGLVTRWAMPFLAAHMVTLAIASYCPIIVTWVPQVFGYM